MDSPKLILLVLIMILMFSGCSAETTTLSVPIQTDIDKDGLTDAMEIKLGTDLFSKDTDGDGISDYWENKKYRTNPLKKDSDGDHILDNDWEERREYTNTIKAIVDLRPPFDINHMNDFYQDAKVVSKLEDDVTRIEVILYPDAEVVFNGSEYKPQNNEFTQPTYSKNYSEKMQKKIKKFIKDEKTDFSVVNKIISTLSNKPPYPIKIPFVLKFTYVELVKDLKCASDLPLQFSLYRDENGDIIEKNLTKSSKYTKQEMLDKVFFADTMFLGKTVGSCGPHSILRGAMLRAAGIQEKSIFTIPLIYYYQEDGTIIDVDEKYNKGYHNLSKKGTTCMADHFFNEVYMSNQWIRVDKTIDTGILVTSAKKPYIKILEFNDSTDYNFSTYWNSDTWVKQGPYKYISVVQQKSKY